MPYPQITEYQEAVQHPLQAFVDPELKQGTVAENNLGLPLVMSGGFALTYAVTTPRRKCAVRCFHREIPEIQRKYDAISKVLRALASGYFVDFDFQQSGINIRQKVFPIVRMDWVEGDTLGVWLDKHFDDPRALERTRADFVDIARLLAKKAIAHGDIQNGNVMVTSGDVRLIDYDGMFVPGMRPGNGSETGHKHFQHPERRAADFGPAMDRFSFIALDLSLKALIADKTLYPEFREGGETIVFKANDFADPPNSKIFQRLLKMPKLKDQAQNFAAVCGAPLAAIPTLDEFLAGRNMPVAQRPVAASPTPVAKPRLAYIPAFPVVDALNFSAAMQYIGDRVELVGRIVEITRGARKRGKAPAKHYVFINFGSWRGNVVKISIWSEGLAKLKEQPSNAWVGRWVSVTGLIDVPVENKRQRYKHLSITVQEEGQIQEIDEAEAGFRLASIASAPPPQARSAPRVDRTAAATPPATGRGSRKRAASGTRRAGRKHAAQTAAAAASTQPATAPSGQPTSARIPRWAQVLAMLAIVAMLVSLLLVT